MNSVQLAHGSGGQAMQQLINSLFMEAFANPWLAEQEDQARLELAGLPDLLDLEAGGRLGVGDVGAFNPEVTSSSSGRHQITLNRTARGMIMKPT